MISTILSAISILMPIITWVFKFIGVKKETQEAFIQKIQSAKDDGLIGIQARDEFKKQDEELKNGSDTVKPPQAIEP